MCHETFHENCFEVHLCELFSRWHKFSLGLYRKTMRQTNKKTRRRMVNLDDNFQNLPVCSESIFTNEETQIVGDGASSSAADVIDLVDSPAGSTTSHPESDTGSELHWSLENQLQDQVDARNARTIAKEAKDEEKRCLIDATQCIGFRSRKSRRDEPPHPP